VSMTPTHGVLVSVSAVVYTRILVSDRISVCPYRPFSNRRYQLDSCHVGFSSRTLW